MEQGNPQKNIGIVISMVVIIGVIASTIFFNMQSSSTSLADQSTSSSIPIQPTTPSPSVSTTNKKVTVSTTNAYQSGSGENEGSGDDEGVGYTTSSGQVPPVQTASVSTPPPPAITNKSSYVYRNGTYSATGSYSSPGGQDQVAVTLTLANDIITSVSVTPQAGDRTSQRYISKFLSGYQQYVVGQDISTLSLGRISGSSLTPIGFNNAISQIRAQAKA